MTWEMSGPEEGDSINTSVFVCDDMGCEIIEIRGGRGIAYRKMMASKIVDLLNECEAELLQ